MLDAEGNVTKVVSEATRVVPFDDGFSLKNTFDLEQQELDLLDRRILENSIINISESIMSNKAHTEEIFTPLDPESYEMDNPDSVINDIIEKTDQSGELDPMNPLTQIKLEIRNKTGSAGIGVYANGLSGRNIAVTVNLPITVDVAPRLIVDGELIILNQMPERAIDDGKTVDHHIQKHITLAADNATKPRMMYLNDNSITSSASIFLMSYGMSSELVSYFRSQPILRELVEAIQNEGGTQWSVGDKIDELRNKYTKQFMTVEERDAFIVELLPAEGEPIIHDMEVEDLTRLDGEVTLENVATQLKYLENFRSFTNSGQVLQNIYRAIMPDTKMDLSSTEGIQELKHY